MTATEVQTLINDVPCDLCNATPGLEWYLVLAAMIDIANGSPVPTTTQGLISEANCLLCLVPPGLLPYLMVQALREISAGGGGGGGGTIQVYEGAFADPNGNVTPTDPTKPALYFPNGGGTLWQFDVPSQTWV